MNKMHIRALASLVAVALIIGMIGITPMSAYAQPDDADAENAVVLTADETTETESETKAEATAEEASETATEPASESSSEAAEEEKAYEEESEKTEASGTDNGDYEKKADVEDEEIWEETLPDSLKTGNNLTEEDYRDNIVKVANSQVGYKESKENYTENAGGTKSYYSRYGEWSSDPYADPWDSEFVNFCLHYAGVRNIPYDGDTDKWQNKLGDKDLCHAVDESVMTGDVVFIEDNDVPRCGIVVGFDTENREIEVVEATVDRDRDEVREEVYSLSDTRLAAYARVVKGTEAEKSAEEPDEDEDIDDESAIVCSADVYADDTKEEKLEDVSITVSGDLPENAAVTAYPVMNDESNRAYKIIITDSEGTEYHSDAGEGKRIKVVIDDPALTKLLTGRNGRGWHKRGEDTTDIPYKMKADGSVVFTTEEF